MKYCDSFWWISIHFFFLGGGEGIGNTPKTGKSKACVKCIGCQMYDLPRCMPFVVPDFFHQTGAVLYIVEVFLNLIIFIEKKRIRICICLITFLDIYIYIIFWAFVYCYSLCRFISERFYLLPEQDTRFSPPKSKSRGTHPSKKHQSLVNFSSAETFMNELSSCPYLLRCTHWTWKRSPWSPNISGNLK